MKQFKVNVTTIMMFLQTEGYSSSVISAHRICYKELLHFLAATGQDYSPVVAYQWIESLQTSYDDRKLTAWRHFIDQLEDIRKTGHISPDHLSYRKPAYSQLNSSFRSVLDGFMNECHLTDNRYRITCARFLLYLQNNGIVSVSELSYDLLLRFHEEDYHRSSKSKDVYENLIRRFLSYLAYKGVCSPGLALALNKLLIHQIIRLPYEELKDYPGKPYPTVTQDTIERFIASIAGSRYGKTVLNCSRHILALLYIFLDMHDVVLNDGIIWHWFDKVRPLLGSNWKQHRRSLCQFLYFLDTGSIKTGITGNPQIIDSVELLPAWARIPLTDYLCLLKREGRQPSTIAMQKSSNLRFCRYLQDAGLNSFAEVTTSVIRDFNLQDRHGTPEGKAAYNCRIRSFIIFLYEQKLV